MELHPMMCLSTAHLQQNTRQELSQPTHKNDPAYRLVVFPKDVYGFFIPVPGADEFAAVTAGLSPDLYDCMAYARQLGVTWLMFDTDGPLEESLPVYDESKLDCRKVDLPMANNLGYRVMLKPLAKA